MIRFANAPVSYGVFDLARTDLVELPEGSELLRLVAEAGYEGIDLGPHGLFGKGQGLVDALASHHLELCGGWLDFPFAGSSADFEHAFAAGLPVLDDFALVASQQPGAGPLPTIADSGSQERRDTPGGRSDLMLPKDRWAEFVRRVERVAAAARERGLEPTFHHHVGTYVETPDEIQRFLDDCSMDLTFDSGHLLIAGGDPVTDFGRWADRVNHLHVKDVNCSLLLRISESSQLLREVWEQRVFVPLGEGDLDVAALAGEVLRCGFSGWLVVEQDVVLLKPNDLRRADADQRRNLQIAREWFA